MGVIEHTHRVVNRHNTALISPTEDLYNMYLIKGFVVSFLDINGE